MYRYLMLLISLVLQGSLTLALDLDELESSAIGGMSFSEPSEITASALPEILSASRLRTPAAEVPASVTLITADQIEAWGVRTVPELMRYVPGMFTGHGDDENNSAVVYHVSNPSVMRRLQVLIDGRSVFLSGVAAVVWNDIPIALEDIQRIEVTRGPNSATYGANSFLGVINIISKHPEDTIGYRMMYRNGDQGIDDGFMSYSWLSGDASYRLSAKLNADDGFDGVDTTSGEDNYRDSHRHGSVVLTRNEELSSGWSLGLQAGFTRGHTDMRKDSFDQSYPDKDTEQGYLWSLLSKKLSEDHEYQIKSYWQYDNKKQGSDVCGGTFVFDPALFDLYRLDPDLVNIFGLEIAPGVTSSADYEQLVAGVASGTVSASDLGPILSSADSSKQYDVSDEEYALLQSALIRAYDGEDFDRLSEVSCGYSDRSIDEQRVDIEFQDTYRWSDSLRTVAGVNFRRDQVNSYTLFRGKVNNDTYRAFGNVEWRPLDWALMNIGGTYESEDANDAVFSPRAAMNFLITPQQSIRLVYSEAVRSPDLLEQNPNYSLRVTSMTDNYLGLDSGVFYMNQWPESRNPDHERIISREIGYYGQFIDPAIEFDLKLFNDHLSALISDPINLRSTRLASDTQMNIRGAEFQLNWQIFSSDSIRLVGAKLETDVNIANKEGLSAEEIARKEVVETRSTAEDSLVFNWTHKGKGWSSSMSYFWYDNFNSYLYRRSELYLKKTFALGRLKPWAGFFWQHQVNWEPLVYQNQRYSKKDTFYGQLGINF